MIYNKINLDYSICTAPRVGSFYLQDRILQHTGVYVKKYHSLKDNKMITIIRDPADMLTSKLAMTAFYDKNNQTINHIRNIKEDTTDLKIYRDTLLKVDLHKDFHTIIDYNDLINHPLETTIAVANIMDLPIINETYIDGKIREYPENSHLLSSKKVDEYNEIRAYVDNLDLSDLYEFYYEAIAKAIKIK